MTVPFREASVDIDAIADNVRHFRRLTGAEVIAVVKANAYGHGAAAAAGAALAGGATRRGGAEIPPARERR
ncbi:MAG: alanine racemase, partial [Microbacterium sp.]|nr:alanine racemase [Microbacterium sp.]